MARGQHPPQSPPAAGSVIHERETCHASSCPPRDVWAFPCRARSTRCTAAPCSHTRRSMASSLQWGRCGPAQAQQQQRVAQTRCSSSTRGTARHAGCQRARTAAQAHLGATNSIPIQQQQQQWSSCAAASSSSAAPSNRCSQPARLPLQQQQQPQPQQLQTLLPSMLAAAAVTLSSALGPAQELPLPLGPPAAAARARMTADEQLTVDIFKRSTPSVVNVTNLAARRDAFTMNMLEIPQGAGSGFLWDGKGHVVTNYHVIMDASDIQVTFMGGADYSAKVIGLDQDKDIAVLEVGLDGDKLAPPPSLLKPLNLCSSSADLLVGQKVFAIGNPFGLDHTLTTGVVSGTGREISSISGRPIQDVIQTDSAINPGNSGGPLLDSGGCLIGINTAIYSPSGANSGVGFAIPVDVVRSSVEQIIAFGKVVRPVLGISFAPDQSSEQLGVKGILVLSAREGGPAWRSGIRGTSRDEYGRLVLGDIITAINTTKIRNSSDLYRVLDKSRVGDSLDIEVLRGNEKQHVTAVLDANA